MKLRFRLAFSIGIVYIRLAAKAGALWPLPGACRSEDDLERMQQMIDTLGAVSRVMREPATFSEYVIQQIAVGLLNGPPLRSDVMAGFPRLMNRMVECEKMRARARDERGVHVPAVLFLAVTGRCNLRCRHCYTQRYAREDMSLALARRILSEAHELGVALVVVSGGEPLLYRDFFAIPREMPDVPFLVFTNGAHVRGFLEAGLESPNLFWLVSVDGPREWNDARRGPGSYDAAIAAMDAIEAARLPLGFSATLSGDNVAAATPEFVASLAARGCRSGYFLEQIPSPASDPPLSDLISEQLEACRREARLPLIGFPADEVRFGGCQAGGNGIAHVSPDGFLEPCPAARLAADSLVEVSLETALTSPFIKEFRDLKERHSTGHEACSYGEHRETFEGALARYGARSTV